MSAATGPPLEVIWHDVECGSYAADLPLWRELAARLPEGGAVLEVGCGTGRVALDLATTGAYVTGIDTRPPLIAEFERRARERGLDAHGLCRDVRELDAPGAFGLVLAPMQVIQLLAGPADRAATLSVLRRALTPGGRIAIAIVEGAHVAGEPGELPPLPDVAEHGGWVYSSLPVDVSSHDAGVTIRRLRQTVAPDGELREELDETRLAVLDAAELEREAAAAGLVALDRHTVAATDAHVGSTVIVLEEARR